MEHGFINAAIEAGASSLAAQRGFMSNVAVEVPPPDGLPTDRHYYHIPDPLAVDAALFGDTLFTLGIDPSESLWPEMLERIAADGTPFTPAARKMLRRQRAAARDMLIKAFPDSESSIRSMFDTYASKLRAAAEAGTVIDDTPIERGSSKGLPRWCSPSSWAVASRAPKGKEKYLADVTAAVRRAYAAGAHAVNVNAAVARGMP